MSESNFEMTLVQEHSEKEKIPSELPVLQPLCQMSSLEPSCTPGSRIGTRLVARFGQTPRIATCCARYGAKRAHKSSRRPHQSGTKRVHAVGAIRPGEGLSVRAKLTIGIHLRRANNRSCSWGARQQLNRKEHPAENVGD